MDPQIASIDMASMLRIAPLLGSAASSMYAYDQYVFLKVFLHPHVGTKRCTEILPSFFDVWFRKGVKVVIGLNTLTSVSALASVLRSDGLPEHSVARQWYWFGFGLTLSHYFFVPFVMYTIRDIVENKNDPLEDLRKWLKLHLIRSALIDVPAMACYVSGALALLNEQA